MSTNVFTLIQSTLVPTKHHHNDYNGLELCKNVFQNDEDEKNFPDDDQANGHALKFLKSI